MERKKFRINLYKLMLVRNILENKVHKEKMSMLYAFEQMIINTEDENMDYGEEQEYYDDLIYGDDIGDYNQPYFMNQPYNLPIMQRVPLENEYLSNPSDIIDEEELEESADE